MSTQTGSISFEATGGFNSYAKQNYATLSQIKGQFATCGTGASTAAKVATIVPTDSGWTLYDGATITVKFTSKNTTTAPTLNVNGTGAKSIKDFNGNDLTQAAYEWPEGAAMSFTYDGSSWRIQDSNLMERVHTAETAIEQNAEDIALRATKEEVNNAIDDVKITKSICGRTITTEDAANLSLLSLDSVYGESIQDGTPTPDAPVYIQAVRPLNYTNIPTNIPIVVLDQLLGSSDSEKEGTTSNGGAQIIITYSNIISKNLADLMSTQEWVDNHEVWIQYDVKTSIPGCVPTGNLRGSYNGYSGECVAFSSNTRTSDGTVTHYLCLDSDSFVDTANASSLFNSGVFRTTDNEWHTVLYRLNPQYNSSQPWRDGGKTPSGFAFTLVPTAVSSATYSVKNVKIFTGSVKSLNLKGNEIYALKDSSEKVTEYRDVLVIDASGHVTIEKRTLKIYANQLVAGNYGSNPKSDDTLGMTLSALRYGNDLFNKTQLGGKTAGYPLPICTFLDGSKNLSSWDGGISKLNSIAGTTNTYPHNIYGCVSSIDYPTIADFNAALVGELANEYVIVGLFKDYWYTIDLGYIDLPLISDGSTVYIASEIQPYICGSWWTKSGQEAGTAHQSSVKENAELRIAADGITSEVSKISSAKYVNSSVTSWTLDAIKTNAADDGVIHTWNISSSTPTTDFRVGDTIYVKCMWTFTENSTTKTSPVYIKTTVKEINSATQFTAVSHGYENALPVDSIKSTINQSADSIKIAANHVDIEGAAIFSSGGAYDKSTTVVKTETQWYSSTSATSKSGGSWGTTQPAITAGRYIWQRELVTYADSSTDYKPSEAGVCTQGQTDLSSYSTTTQMNSAIGSAKSEIIYDVDDGYGVLMPFSRRMNLTSNSVNQSTGTWRLAGSSQMTRTRELISDGPYGACYCFQSSGIQTNADDSSCYGLDSFSLGNEWDSSKIYMASMYARVINGSGMAGFAFYGANYLDGSHNTVWGSYKMTTLTSNWTKVWVTFTRTNKSANIYIGAAGADTTTAATVQMCMFRIEEFNGNYGDIQTNLDNLSNALGGFDILWNRAYFASDQDAGGECYLCALDPLTNQRSDTNGWAMWNGTKRTITKGIYNINAVAPYNIPIYIVYRLSSATSTTGAGYYVWYNSGWKSTPQSAGTVSAWTWAETTDMVLGKFVEPGSEVAFTECETYNPPRKWGAITTDTTTAHSAQNTANNAAPKASAVSRTQRIYYQSASTTKPATPGTASSDWVSDESGAPDKWTLKRMSYSSVKPYIYTCEQKQVVSGTVSYTPVLLDDTTTVIDGGKIITGSVDANAINANTISGSNLTISSFKDSDNYLNSNIQVGGKNLLYNSSIITGSDYGSLSSSPIDGGTAGSEKHVESTNAWNGIGIALHTALQRAGAKIGDTVTMSIWVSNTSTEAISRDIYLYRANTSSSTPGVNNPGGTNTYARLSLKSGEWQRVYVTFEVTDYALNTVKTTRFETSVTDSTNKMLWTAPQLEFGNVVTDWRSAPEDTEASILGSGVEYIAGTQTAATGNWTGITKETSLIAGKTIAYKLPYAGSGNASLQLKDENGNNVGGNIAVYSMTTRVTTHYPAGSIIQMTYDGTYWRTSGWYNTNNVDRKQHANYIKAIENIPQYRICAGTSSGYKAIAASTSSTSFTFDISYPLLYLYAANISGQTYALAANGQSLAFYETLPSITVTNNGAVQSAAVNKMVYLKGTLDGNTFKTAISNYLTCTIPTAETSPIEVYLPLGMFPNNSTTAIYFDSPRTMYAYIDGKFRQVTPTEIVATHRIYYRTATANSSLAAPTTWIDEAAANVYNTWTTKVPPLASGTDSSVTGYTKYPYLYTCEQRKRLDGTVECTKVLLDENTTVIDGGNIITNSITANQIASNTITANEIDATNLHVNAANIDGTITFGQLSGVQASGDYALNSDIPTKVSDLTNDSGFQTSSQVETAITDKGYATNTNLTTEINQRKAQYGTCNTAAATQAKVVTCANFELVAGNELTVKFSTANTYASGTVQLNINSKGAKNVWVGNAVTSTTNKLLWGANAYITFRYDGTQFIVIGEPRTWYGACTTAEGTAAKTDTTAVTGCVICKGTKVELAMTNANTADAPTLNIQSTGALAIYFGNGTTRPTKAGGTSWLAANTCTFTFDGATWRTQGKTYIDANSIITGSVDAERIKANVVSAINATVDQIDAKNIKASELQIGQSQVTNLTNDIADAKKHTQVIVSASNVNYVTNTCALTARLYIDGELQENPSLRWQWYRDGTAQGSQMTGATGTLNVTSTLGIGHRYSCKCTF